LVDAHLEMAAAMVAPPPRAPTYAEFAAALFLPDGPQAGERWDPQSEPAQAVKLAMLDGKILDFNGDPFRELIDVSAAQTGKSLTDIIVPAMRAATALGQNVVYCLPTMDLVSKVWTTKLLPSLRGCGLGPWLPDKGPGSKGGKPVALPLVNPVTKARAGSIIFLAGGSGAKREAGQAGVSAGIVLNDEADEYENAHRLALVDARAAAFGRNSLKIKTSTVKKDSNSVILSLFREATGSRLWFACPHCHRFQPLEWEQVRYDGTDDLSAEKSARFHCIHCAVGWSEQDRHKALESYRVVHRGQEVDESGTVTGPIPRTKAFGLLTPKLDFHLGAEMGELAVEHRRAKARLEETGDHGLMRSFYRDRLAREYTAEIEEMEAGSEITHQYLYQRSIRCEWGPARHVTDRAIDAQPTYSRHLADPHPSALGAVAGVDVQRDRLYWVLVAYGPDGTTWDQAWGYEYARPDHAHYNRAELFGLLDHLDHVLHEYAGTLPLITSGIDVGDQTDDLLAWLKGKPQWKATKGASGTLKDEPGDIPGIVHRRDGLYHVAIDAVRELIHSAYRRPNGQPGAAHIPNGLQNSGSDLAYLKHLCAERMTLDPKTKKFKLVHPGGRWDWQDARRIAEVMVRLQLRPKRTGPTRKYGAVGTVKAF
jgi:hypothetical protein